MVRKIQAWKKLHEVCVIQTVHPELVHEVWSEGKVSQVASVVLTPGTCLKQLEEGGVCQQRTCPPLLYQERRSVNQQNKAFIATRATRESVSSLTVPGASAGEAKDFRMLWERKEEGYVVCGGQRTDQLCKSG